MKLDLLKEIAETVRTSLQQEGLTCEWHYFFESHWYSLDDPSQDVESDVISALAKSKNDPVAYHAPKSKIAWFYLPDFQANVSVSFPSSPTIKTRQAYQEKIQGIQKNAVNAFKVTHNELTGLLSRDAFRERLMRAIEDLGKAKPKAIILASEGGSLNSVNVLAFDIDKFKQVNDTYGHIYGDQVLKAFAWRLEKVAREVKSDTKYSVRISLGHPSGEEFLVLVHGQPTAEDLIQIAEQFRQSIAEDPLPSDDEWQRLSANAGLSKVQLPPKNERSVTTSVGVVSYAGATKPDASATLSLLDKADIALYKSKSGGRNRVTLFDEILKKCGRVLEHNAITGIVAIDIGSKVGVLQGQEFRVYPIMFNGEGAMTVDDGRSRKTLGTYPKFEICRIIVFNVQTDVGFAYVSSPSSFSKCIEVGAYLEAVPLGHITHLIDKPGFVAGFPEPEYESHLIFTGAELQESVESLITNRIRPFSAVIKFRRENDFHKKYGSAALNRALARLFSSLRAKFSDGQKVGMIDNTVVCIIGDQSSFSPSDVSSLLSELHTNEDELEPVFGFYQPVPTPTDGEAEAETLDVGCDNHAIELARYALSIAENENDSEPIRFSTKTAETILSRHRAARSNAAGIADYLRFREIGIRSATIENTGGLLYSSAGEYAEAIECYQRALELKPQNTIFRGNAVIIASKLNQFELGLKLMADISNDKLEQLKNLHANAIWAYARMLLDAREADSPLYDAERLIRVGSLALSLHDARTRQDFSRLQQTVEMLSPQSAQ